MIYLPVCVYISITPEHVSKYSYISHKHYLYKIVTRSIILHINTDWTALFRDVCWRLVTDKLSYGS